MASASFDFDELNDMVDEVPSTTTDTSFLPTGEFLNFDAFVEVSFPDGNTGGEDVTMDEDDNDLKSHNGRHGEESRGSGVGLVKLTVHDVKRVCGGMIRKSNGGRFCCRFKCNIASHKTQKVPLREDETRFYIGGSRDGQAWTTPSLPISRIDDVNIRMMETSEKPKSVWSLLFQRFEIKTTSNIEDINDSFDKNITDGDVNVGDQIKVIEAAKLELKTPKRTRFHLIDEIREVAIDKQPLSLQKRVKLTKLQDIVKSEDPDTAKVQLIGQIIQQWDDIIAAQLII